MFILLQTEKLHRSDLAYKNHAQFTEQIQPTLSRLSHTTSSFLCTREKMTSFYLATAIKVHLLHLSITLSIQQM